MSAKITLLQVLRHKMRDDVNNRMVWTAYRSLQSNFSHRRLRSASRFCSPLQSRSGLFFSSSLCFLSFFFLFGPVDLNMVLQYKLSTGGEVIRTDIQVGDDTLPFFSVSLWQKQLAAKAVAGDVILLQSKLFSAAIHDKFSCLLHFGISVRFNHLFDWCVYVLVI